MSSGTPREWGLAPHKRKYTASEDEDDDPFKSSPQGKKSTKVSKKKVSLKKQRGRPKKSISKSDHRAHSTDSEVSDDNSDGSSACESEPEIPYSKHWSIDDQKLLNRTGSRERTLWKRAHELGGNIPPEYLGELSVATISKNKVSTEYRVIQNTHWEEQFCGAFSTLLCNPFLAKYPVLVQYALQHAVRARIAKSKKRSRFNPPDMEIMNISKYDKLKDGLEAASNMSTKSIGDFLKANGILRKQYPDYWEFTKGIPDIVNETNAPRGIHAEAYYVDGVTIADIKAISNAWDEYAEGDGRLVLKTMEEYAHSIRKARKGLSKAQVLQKKREWLISVREEKDVDAPSISDGSVENQRGPISPQTPKLERRIERVVL